MATFVDVNAFSGKETYRLNLDTVLYLQTLNDGSTKVHFVNGHSINILDDAGTLAKKGQ